MHFFNRNSLYPRKGSKQVRPDWDVLFQRYNRHLHSIRSALPESAWLLTNFAFHDAVVRKVAFGGKSEVEFTITDGWISSIFDDPIVPDRWLKAPGFVLTFRAVKNALVPPSIGDIWLYEEMHLCEGAAFEYRVLLHKHEFMIQADQVEIQPLPIGRKL